MIRLRSNRKYKERVFSFFYSVSYLKTTQSKLEYDFMKFANKSYFSESICDNHSNIKILYFQFHSNRVVVWC